MPNESLIQQIETLRDRFVRQQKAASTLQSSLKTVTDAHNRVQKALSDYGEQNSATDVNNLQTTLVNTRLKETVIDPLLPDLRRELKSVTTMVAALKDVANALHSEPVDVAKLDKGIGLLRPSGQSDVDNLLPELDRELELAQRALGDEFGGKLRDALAEQGIGIAGRAPKFEIGRFELEANFAKRFVTLLYGRDVVVPRAPITVDATMKAYQNAAKLIAGRSQEGQSWIAQFYAAYDNARRKRDGNNPRVNIVDCYVEFAFLNQGRNFLSEPSKRTFKDYSRAQFIYDFYEYADRQRLTHNGQAVKAHSATKSQTDNPTKSMWIVEGDTPYDGRYIADIEFAKE